jgi:hypothetical protein
MGKRKELAPSPLSERAFQYEADHHSALVREANAARHLILCNLSDEAPFFDRMGNSLIGMRYFNAAARAISTTVRYCICLIPVARDSSTQTAQARLSTLVAFATTGPRLIVSLLR